MSVIVRSSSGNTWIHAKWLKYIYMIKSVCMVSLLYTSPILFFAVCVCVCVCVWAGRLYLFCKGADSAIFPRVISGKVDQVRARVEHNAVVSTHTHTHTHDSHEYKNTESMSHVEHFSHDSGFQIVWFHLFPITPHCHCGFHGYRMALFRQTVALCFSIEGPMWLLINQMALGVFPVIWETL